MLNVTLAMQQLYKAAVAAEGSPLAGIKRVFLGDPITLPENDQPAIAIMPMVEEYELRGSRYDQRDCTIEVRTIYNLKDYFDGAKMTTKAITGAVAAGAAITFTVTGHGLAVGDAVEITGVLPAAFNGTYAVASVLTDDTFTVSKTITETYTSGGSVVLYDLDLVPLVKAAMVLTSSPASGSPQAVAANTITGVIQKNPELPYTSGGVTVKTATLAQVTRVRYSFGVDRGFSTFEIITEVLAKLVGDR